MSTLEVSNLNDGTTTVATSYITNGSAKVWCNVNQTSTQAIRDSFNVSSITDDGTGQTDIAYTSNMSSADYGFTCGKGRTSAQNGGVIAHTNDTDPTASLIRIMSFQENNTTIDEARANVSVNGDLA
jgi:hypothetical protein